MDPNVTLAALRQLIEEGPLKDASDETTVLLLKDHIDDVGTMFGVLDNWITRGRNPPRDWAKGH